jgi:pyridoxamine 5'-phosphate oxidase
VTDVPPLHDGGLDERVLGSDPIALFRAWLAEAAQAGIVFPEAAALATADAAGRPAVRHVLIKAVDERGFTFFTNLESRKARQIAENPHAALAILWREVDRQVSATGTVTPIPREDTEAYFRTRPRDARIGAWASKQSRVLSSREELERAFAASAARYPGDDVPTPPYWGGLRLAPEAIEFWKGREHRLHDRFRFTRQGAGWLLERLWP